MILMLWLLLEITLLLGACPNIYLTIFRNSYVCLGHQFTLGSQAKESIAVQVMALKFLYALFFKAMSKE